MSKRETFSHGWDIVDEVSNEVESMIDGSDDGMKSCQAHVLRQDSRYEVLQMHNRIVKICAEPKQF